MMKVIDVVFVFEIDIFVACWCWFSFGAGDEVPAAIGGEEEFGGGSPGAIVVGASELGKLVEFANCADGQFGWLLWGTGGGELSRRCS